MSQLELGFPFNQVTSIIITPLNCYARPKFAILDECSSAVSVDVEGQLYERCKELGITLFSVSHRRSLWHHHEFLLRFDGQGGYEFRKMTPEDFGGGAWGS